MHPYEMATTMRQRGQAREHQAQLRLALHGRAVAPARGLIEAQETEREGRRPERTVYRLLDAGRMELIDWLSEMLSTPAKEFTQFEAGSRCCRACRPRTCSHCSTTACRPPRTRSSQSAA